LPGGNIIFVGTIARTTRQLTGDVNVKEDLIFTSATKEGLHQIVGESQN
jgi:hypothetical protein